MEAQPGLRISFSSSFITKIIVGMEAYQFLRGGGGRGALLHNFGTYQSMDTQNRNEVLSTFSNMVQRTK